MKYITHHRYKGLALCGERLNIPYGTELEADGSSLVGADGKPVCFLGSENAKMHFAQNDDGRGLERGALTYALAYGRRERKWLDKGIRRFSEAEVEMLERSWGHWLRQDVDTILFNEDFFAAQPEDLKRLADALNN